MDQNKPDDFLLVIISVTVLILLLSSFIITFFFLYKKTRDQHVFEKKTLEVMYTQTLLQSQLEIQEQTLKNISQEIHDNVGQVLTLAKLNLATTTTESEMANEKITTTKQLIGKAIQDLRDLSRSLNTDYVEEMGLLRSIEYELDMLRKTGTLETQFSIQGTAVRLEKQKELILFRILQESIHNIIKHADAKTITVSVLFADHMLQIKVVDDGNGFDLSPLNDPSNNSFGLGLKNMNSRATLIGAGFLMESAPGNGTEIHLRLPLNNLEHETTNIH